MKIRYIICSILAVGLLAGGLVGRAGEKEDEAGLAAKAKISKAEAERIALAKVPNGTIKEAGLEKEKGKVIWSLDIATPGTKDITEVAVDAMTGEVVAIDKETPKQEAKEKEKDEEAGLAAKAKISKAEAERIALAKVPNGTIKEGGIEKEKGKVIWSFDIATPGTKDITEVAVDAMTGEVVAIDKETPNDEAKEKAEKKSEKEEDEKDDKK